MSSTIRNCFPRDSGHLPGYLYTAIVIFIITAVSNGANITDGLDGLATGISAIIGPVWAYSPMQVATCGLPNT